MVRVTWGVERRVCRGGGDGTAGWCPVPVSPPTVRWRRSMDLRVALLRPAVDFVVADLVDLDEW
jgi:hypothetical protein